MPKVPTNVKVSTFDTELQFSIQNKTRGKSLFDQVVQTTGIREVWYFGFYYTDSRNQPSWLRLDKKISQQDVKKEALLKFQFQFKYYPENVADEVVQDLTMKLLYLQVKNDILNENIYCPAEKAVLMSSYQVQAKFSDYDEELHTPGYLDNEKLLPQSVVSQHVLSSDEWEQKVATFHKQHRGMTREEAMLEYLKIAQDLEMFGVNYFPIYNKRGTEMMLGVDALGINVYDKNNKLTPKISFPWSEIKKISYSGDKFKVRLNDKGSSPFEGRSKEPKATKKIYDLCSGNHEMYVRRRKPDTLEVQQMKVQKMEEKKTRDRERAALKREIAARETIEKSRLETEAKLQALQEEMERHRNELEDARETIERLERQLRETQETRKELEKQQDELRAMLDKLEADRDMEQSERQKLEEEIRAKQSEISNVRDDVEAKEAEARRLQEEMDEAKRQLQDTTLAMNAALAAATKPPEPEVVQQNGASGTTSSSSSSEHGGSDNEDDNLPKILVDDVEFKDEDRETDKKTEDLLKDLRSELDTVRDPEQEREVDQQHRLNVTQGRDKFKTLRDIRRGNTKRRIDNFENM